MNKNKNGKNKPNNRAIHLPVVAFPPQFPQHLPLLQLPANKYYRPISTVVEFVVVSNTYLTVSTVCTVHYDVSCPKYCICSLDLPCPVAFAFHFAEYRFREPRCRRHQLVRDNFAHTAPCEKIPAPGCSTRSSGDT